MKPYNLLTVTVRNLESFGMIRTYFFKIYIYISQQLANPVGDTLIPSPGWHLPPRSELQQSLRQHQEKQQEMVQDLKLDPALVFLPDYSTPFQTLIQCGMLFLMLFGCAFEPARSLERRWPFSTGWCKTAWQSYRMGRALHQETWGQCTNIPHTLCMYPFSCIFSRCTRHCIMQPCSG